MRMVALALSMLLATPAMAQKLSLNEISQYLNSFSSATGEFTQINDDGTISTGQIYIKRPGRVRFEYNPPEQTLVVADGDTVGIMDPKSEYRGRGLSAGSHAAEDHPAAQRGFRPRAHGHRS